MFRAIGFRIYFELYITSKFWGMQVRLASLVENGFNAVERISEYSNLSEEAATNIDGSKPNGWPSRGLVGSSCSPVKDMRLEIKPLKACARLDLMLEDWQPIKDGLAFGYLPLLSNIRDL